jgi:hypothetical protein
MSMRDPSQKPWRFTRRECEAQRPPHRLQVARGGVQLCLLCGSKIGRAILRTPRAA